MYLNADADPTCNCSKADIKVIANDDLSPRLDKELEGKPIIS